jgi:hypothetical protein
MKFAEALEELKAGKKIGRKAWEKNTFIKNQEVDTPNKKFGEPKVYKETIVPYVYNLNIIDSNDWLMVGETQKYKFADIAILLLRGAKARFQDWEDGSYIFFDRQEKCLFWRYMSVCDMSTPDFMSFVAEDWYIYE